MRAICLLLVAGCAGPESHDVVGPFTGDVHRYVVDAFDLPRTPSEARAVAADLNGDSVVDNQLGEVTASLFSQDDGNTHDVDIIRAGVIASTVEIQADDLIGDPTVGVTYIGADGEPAVAVGGRLIDGAFASNRTADTRVPGSAVLHLPVLADADPVVVEIDGLEIDLSPDGLGGFDAIVRGGVPATQLLPAVVGPLVQMLDANPGDHRGLALLLDTNKDGVISTAELTDPSGFVAALLAPDIRLFDRDGTYDPGPSSDGPLAVSAAFRLHLAPCPAGRCIAGLPADPCHDRVLDGDETDVDCGGSCGPCGTARACLVPTDCQSNACDAGACRAPTCNDGVQDGFESGIDCGAIGCRDCSL